MMSPAIQRLIEQNRRRFPVNDNEDPVVRDWREQMGLSREEFEREAERYT